MSKSKRRISHEASRALREKELDLLKREAIGVAESILFYLGCIGGKCESPLDYSFESLVPLESIFRSLLPTSKSLPPDLPLDMLSRLMGIYLGEVIVKHRNGQWATYDGGYHTLTGFVVQVGESYYDPLLFVALLPNATAFPGIREGKALYHYAKSGDRVGKH